MIAYSIIMFVTAVPILALGIAVYKGNTELIHDYHQKNVKESERLEYGKAMAKGLFVICVTLLISGIIALFGEENPVVAVSQVVLFAGLIASFVVLVKVQMKYNGGLF